MNDMMANAPFCHQSYFSGEKFSCFATKFLKFRFFCDGKKVFLFPSSILAAGLLSGIQLPRIIGSGRDLLSYSLCHTESECRSMLQNTKLNITELSHELCTSLFSFAVSGPTEHCPIFHFPSVRPPFVRPFVRHRRDISTFLDILTVYTMKTIYFLNAYHLGW